MITCVCVYVYEVFVFKFLSCKFVRPLKKRKKIEGPEGLPGLLHAFVCELCCILIVLDNYVYCEHVVNDQSD